MLDIADIKRLASLSKLELKDNEGDAYKEEISKIIDFVEELQSVDTDGIIPTFHGNQNKNVYREDSAKLSHLNEALLANAPDAKDGYIRVPVILESEEA